MVPKVVPRPPPVVVTPFDPSASWVSDENAVKPILAVCILDGEVFVEPFAWSQEFPTLRDLVGTVIESRSESLPVGLSVACISDASELGKRFIGEGRYPVQIIAEVGSSGLAGDLLSILVTGLSLNSCHTMRTTKKLRVLIQEPKTIAAVLRIFE